MNENDLIEFAWGIIANVSGGDWTKQNEDWQEAAKKWRGNFHEWLEAQPRSEEVEHETGENEG